MQTLWSAAQYAGVPDRISMHVLQPVTRQNRDRQNWDGQNRDRHKLDCQNLERKNRDKLTLVVNNV